MMKRDTNEDSSLNWFAGYMAKMTSRHMLVDRLNYLIHIMMKIHSNEYSRLPIQLAPIWQEQTKNPFDRRKRYLVR